jgi:uncharacterized protein (TIGR03086 family)
MEDEVRRAGLAPDVVAQLAAVLETVSCVVADLEPDGWAAPSPCEDWDVRGVVEHLAAVTSKFTRFAEGEVGIIRQDRGDRLGGDPVVGFASIVHESRATWRAHPEAMTRVCHLPFGRFDGATAAGINLFDVVVHGWDVATAVGVAWPIDDRAVAMALDVCDLLVTDEARTAGQFGRPRPRTASTSAMRELLARTGRG